MRTFTILLVVFVVASVGAMWLLIEAGVDGTAARYAAGAVFLIPRRSPDTSPCRATAGRCCGRACSVPSWFW